MTVQPEPAPLMSARSLIHGQGHPSQGSRLRRSWRLETSGQVFGVRRALPSDLPAVMGALVRSSALSRWQWRRSRGGAVPSLTEMSAWLTRRGSLIVLAPGRAGPRSRVPRVVGLAGLGPVDCAGVAIGHAAHAEVLVSDPWQHLGIGRALIAHLGAASWLLGRPELMAPPTADAETADHLLATLGPLTTTTHPHGAHTRVRLTTRAVAGLGPLRGARLG
jgi:GNAT superfamily N-acetyltransferase